MPGERPIRVVIADDHPVVREGLAALLRRHRTIKIVSEAATGREAVDQFILHRPDVMLLDLRMPEMTGLEAIREICKRIPEACIIVISTYDGDEDIYQALRAGAKGYLLKDSTPEVLVESVRNACKGKPSISPDVGVKLAARVGDMRLTSRERDVLQLLAAGKSNKEIGAALQISEGTVKVHVTRILRKLSVAGRSEAIMEALRRGLVHLEQPLVIPA